MGETSKCFDRRMREGWFLKYIQNNVLDIGCGNEPVSDECARWDITHGNGDATFMEGIADHSFDTVYCSAPEGKVCSPKGWITINSVIPGSKVLGRSGWTTVNRVMRIEYAGRPLFLVKSPQGISKVTANHSFATPFGWLNADKFRKSTKTICCTTAVEPSNFIDRLNIFIGKTCGSSLDSFSSLPIAKRKSSSTKGSNNFSLPTLADEMWNNTHKQVNKGTVTSADDYSLALFPSTNSLFNLYPMGKRTRLGNYCRTFLKDFNVAVCNLNGRHQTFRAPRINIDSDTSLPVNNSSEPSNLFLGDVHIENTIHCIDYVVHLETEDGTFFLDGMLSHNSYHCLEHLAQPEIALKNWFRILKPGGWLIVGVPHRDLYEKKQLLPSSFNPDHKTFWLPVGLEAPDTLGLLDTFQSALGAAFKLQSLVIQDSGHFSDHEPNTHPVGEYTIEIIVRKV